MGLASSSRASCVVMPAGAVLVLAAMSSTSEPTLLRLDEWDEDAAEARWTFEASAGNPPELTLDVWLFDVTRTKTLLVRHPLRGWVMPGGKALPGEPPRDAAVRELFEETGLVVAPTELRPVARHLRAGELQAPSYELVVDAAVPVNGEPGQPAKWWSLDAVWPSVYRQDRARLRRQVAES
ncbi:MAG: NUDIX hydrolase [Chloroflexi bacterium]|nr:NUDIX hydrolase [Chloroflexota bacterium]